jgi:hypothetical protein
MIAGHITSNLQHITSKPPSLQLLRFKNVVQTELAGTFITTLVVVVLLLLLLAQQPTASQGRLILEVSRSHTITHYSR